ncbi:MAG: ABC transporter ATP-binding protein [Gemmatimonadetes bacterium]|nr:ABC transporter ATP-binding protein [Gemmatimonadota bacterium]
MKLYGRLLRYLWPHRGLSALSFAIMLLYAVLDGVSWVMFVPFLRILFDPGPGGGAEVARWVEPPPPSWAASGGGDGAEVPSAAGSELARAAGGLRDWLLDAVGGSTRMETLTHVCVAILVVFLLKSIVNYAQLVLPRVVEERAARDLRNEVFEHLHRLSLPFFQRVRSGNILNVVVSDIGRIKPTFSQGVHRLAQKVLEAGVALAVLLYTSWSLTLVTLLVVPPLIYIVVQVARRMRAYNRTAMAQFAELTGKVQENIFAMRVIKAFTAEGREVRRFRRDNRAYYRTALKAGRYGVIGTPLSEFVVAAGVVLILWYGGYQVLVQRTLEPEMFFLFLAFTIKLNAPLKFLSQFNEMIQPALAAAERMFGLLDTVPEVAEPPDPVRIASFRDRIRYEGVSFEYEGDGDPAARSLPALRGVSLEIARGEIVALVGPSGAGKSTLVDLLPRFHDPTAGRILLDSHDLRTLALDDLRGLLGIVTQETLLFHDTVRTNIAYANPAATAEAIVEAARTANAYDFIRALPQGFDTVLGERGLRLSGGERQRIAIARAVLKNPPILILDEATSSLDTTSERLVQEALHRLMRERTTIVIAHRLSTVRHADRIVVLAGGAVVEEGTHAELLEHGELYRRLHEAQFQEMPRGEPATSPA